MVVSRLTLCSSITVRSSIWLIKQPILPPQHFYGIKARLRYVKRPRMSGNSCNWGRPISFGMTRVPYIYQKKYGTTLMQQAALYVRLLSKTLAPLAWFKGIMNPSGPLTTTSETNSTRRLPTMTAYKWMCLQSILLWAPRVCSLSYWCSARYNGLHHDPHPLLISSEDWQSRHPLQLQNEKSRSEEFLLASATSIMQNRAQYPSTCSPCQSVHQC